MMTRPRILLLFALAAAAVLVFGQRYQNHGTPTKPPYEAKTWCLHTGQQGDCPSIPRPKNGQCPVCGTMAHPFHSGQASTQDAYYPFPSSQRFTICHHCNTVFRQWAEGREPKR